jgi:hypothetical protein
MQASAFDEVQFFRAIARELMRQWDAKRPR